jgi:hypothetical protein
MSDKQEATYGPIPDPRDAEIERLRLQQYVSAIDAEERKWSGRAPLGSLGHAVMAVADAEQADLRAALPAEVACAVCDGTGNARADLEDPDEECARCAGTGRVPSDEAALRAELEAEYGGILSRQGDLLTRTANALRGDPPPLTSWSHHDVPELAEQAVTDVRNLLQDKETISALVTKNRERAEAAEARLRNVARCLDDEEANLADDGARLSHSVVRRLRAIVPEPAEVTPPPTDFERAAAARLAETEGVRFCDDKGIIVRGPGVGWVCTGSVHYGTTEVPCASPIHREVTPPAEQRASLDDRGRCVMDPIEVIVDAIKTQLALCCNADSRKPMPERAQRIIGHEFYRCCLATGHEGPHRWPRDGSIVEWEAPRG